MNNSKTTKKECREYGCRLNKFQYCYIEFVHLIIKITGVTTVVPPSVTSLLFLLTFQAFLFLNDK